MGDYDFKPSGSLKLKGVKDKKIKKSKKEKSKKESVPAKLSPAPEDTPPTEKYVVVQTEAEKRFEEIQRQRVRHYKLPPGDDGGGLLFDRYSDGGRWPRRLRKTR
jgi:hypothetical protein